MWTSKSCHFNARVYWVVDIGGYLLGQVKKALDMAQFSMGFFFDRPPVLVVTAHFFPTILMIWGIIHVLSART